MWGSEGHAFDLARARAPACTCAQGPRLPAARAASWAPPCARAPWRQPGYRCPGVQLASLPLPAAFGAGLASLVPPSRRAQMQAVALPEEIRWLLEGNSWAQCQTSALTPPLREVPSAAAPQARKETPGHQPFSLLQAPAYRSPQSPKPSSLPFSHHSLELHTLCPF